LKRLVWYKQHESMIAAIQREKSLWCSSPKAVFMDGRDDGPAMTVIGCASLRLDRTRKREVNAFLESLPRAKTHTFLQHACPAAELRFSPDSRARFAGMTILFLNRK